MSGTRTSLRQFAERFLRHPHNISHRWRLLSSSIFFAAILLSFAVRILMYTVQRSLWLDEAMLAYSLNLRSLGTLLKGPFEMNQIAPIVYLYCVKLITSVFGASETTLRVFSLFTCGGTVLLVWMTQRRLFHGKHPVRGAAFVATMSLMMYYSNEFKPYMSDCFFSLAALYAFYLKTVRRIGMRAWIVASVALILASNPALFLVAAFFLFDFLDALMRRDRKRALETFAGGTAVLACFAGYYFFWLRKVALSDHMNNYWQEAFVRLFPPDPGTFATATSWLRDLGPLWRLVVALALVGGVRSVLQRNRYGIVILIAGALTIVASGMEMYPFSSRLMLFAYPLVALLAFYAVEWLLSGSCTWRREVPAFACALLLLAGNGDFLEYRFESRVLVYGEEANSLIDYVRSHIHENESLYVYNLAEAVFAFRNGYSSTIGDFSHQNVVVGTIKAFTEENVYHEADRIHSLRRCYILMQHDMPGRTELFQDTLDTLGTLEVVSDAAGTLLLYYCADPDDSKADAKITAGKPKMDLNGLCALRLTIHNTGSTILQPWYKRFSPQNSVYVCAFSGEDLVFAQRLCKSLAPSMTCDVDALFPWPQRVETLEFQLMDSRGLCFASYGAEPLSLKRQEVLAVANLQGLYSADEEEGTWLNYFSARRDIVPTRGLYGLDPSDPETRWSRPRSSFLFRSIDYCENLYVECVFQEPWHAEHGPSVFTVCVNNVEVFSEPIEQGGIWEQFIPLPFTVPEDSLVEVGLRLDAAPEAESSALDPSFGVRSIELY